MNVQGRDERTGPVSDPQTGEKLTPEQERTRAANRLFHMVLRQAQAAYSAGLRDGAEACMEWLGNALRGPGQLPPEGSDPQWYAEDAWTEGPPWQAIPKANATVSEPWQPPVGVPRGSGS